MIKTIYFEIKTKILIFYINLHKILHRPYIKPMMHFLTVGPTQAYTRTVTITQKFDTGIDFI